MKFKFKIQQYQTDAVRSTTTVFTGQPNRNVTRYRRDIGSLRNATIFSDEEEAGYRNADVELTKQQLVKRIAVHGFEIKNLKGTSGYMYLDGNPRAKGLDDCGSHHLQSVLSTMVSAMSILCLRQKKDSQASCKGRQV